MATKPSKLIGYFDGDIKIMASAEFTIPENPRKKLSEMAKLKFR